MDEVNVDPVDLRHELRQGIQLRLRLAPVVVRAPVAHELLQLRQLHALRPIGDGLLVGPPRCGDAPAEIDERRLRNLNLERADGGIFGLAVAREGKEQYAGSERRRQFARVMGEPPLRATLQQQAHCILSSERRRRGAAPAARAIIQMSGGVAQ